jgi:hypothetical protein
VGQLFFAPRLNTVKSVRIIAETLAARPEKPTSIACSGIRPEGIRFYGGGPASTEPLTPALEREHDQFLGVCTDEHFDLFTPADRARFRILDTTRVGTRNVYLLGKSSP